MTTERERIEKLLAEGKVSPEEAERRRSALDRAERDERERPAPVPVPCSGRALSGAGTGMAMAAGVAAAFIGFFPSSERGVASSVAVGWRSR